MDSVEVPLPANVVVAKLLGQEGFGGSFVEGEIAALPVPFHSHRDKFSPAVISNSSRTDSSSLGLPVSVHKLVSRCAVKDEISCSPYNSPFVNSDGKACGESGFKATENGLLCELHESRENGTKSKTGKVTRNGGSSRRRSRSSLAEESLHLVDQTDITQLLVGKIGLNDLPCAPICDERSRLNRKHGHSCKKGDKRNCKPVQTTGGDFLGWKIGSISSNLIGGGNNILGIYGLKVEPVNVSKYIADLTLTDLLYGHFEVASLSRTDGKETDKSKQNILQAVQSVFQLLPSCSVTSGKNMVPLESNCNVKGQFSRSSVDPNTVERINSDVQLEDNMDQENVAVEAPLATKGFCGREPYEADLRASVKATPKPVFPVHKLPLYEPGEFLRRLRLPSVETMDSLLSQTPVQEVAGLQCSSVSHSKTQMVGNIPPFTWSLPLGGSCKISLDPVRLSVNQRANRRHWVRIDTIEHMTNYCQSESKSINFQNNSAMKLESRQIAAISESEKKVNRCLNSETSITFVDQGVSCPTICQPVSQAVVKSDIISLENTSLIDSSQQSDLKMSEVNNYSFYSHYKKYGHGNGQCVGKASSIEAILKSEDNETYMGQLESDCPAGLTDKHLQVPVKLPIFNQTAGNTKNNINPVLSLAATAAQFRQSYGTSPSHVQHDTPVSPRLLAAAQILYDMAHCLTCQEKQSQTIEKNRSKAFDSCHGMPSQKAAKNKKTRHSMGKDAVLQLPTQELKSRVGGVSMLENKVPVVERRKSPSQVNDTISRPAKQLASTIVRVAVGITTGFRDASDLGDSPDGKE